jgi:hypothetical protein
MDSVCLGIDQYDGIDLVIICDSRGIMSLYVSDGVVGLNLWNYPVFGYGVLFTISTARSRFGRAFKQFSSFDTQYITSFGIPPHLFHSYS